MTVQECSHLCGPGEPIHGWFGLTYANYLVLHRSVLQSMPEEWQSRFVECLEELREAASDLDIPVSFAVQVRRDDGRFGSDPIPHYDRGRTRLPLSAVEMRHVHRPVVTLPEEST